MAESPAQAAAVLAEELGHEGILQREQAGIKLSRALKDPGELLAFLCKDRLLRWRLRALQFSLYRAMFERCARTCF